MFDEFFGGTLRIGLGLQGSGDFRLGDHPRETVRTEQQNIARKKLDLFDIHFHFWLST